MNECVLTTVDIRLGVNAYMVTHHTHITDCVAFDSCHTKTNDVVNELLVRRLSSL